MKRKVDFVLLILALIWSSTWWGIAQEKKEPKKAGEQVVYIVDLKGDIFEGLANRVRSKLQRIDRQKAKAVILEIDTPGGVVGHVLSICKTIDNLTQSGVNVHCFITGYAWSGGALVSLSCETIYMREHATIGSAEVKILTPFGVQDADEKTLSVMRAQFRDYAQHRNYPEALAEAMVDKRMEVREISYRGQREFKSAEKLLEMRNNPAINPEQIIEREIIVPAGKLANFTAKEAKDYGFCREIYNTREELLKGIGLSSYPVEELQVTFEETLANFLTNKWVRFSLVALGILGLIIEFMTPGFGLPGILGLTCFALFFLGGYLAEMAEVWEIIIFVLGLALVAIEIFVFPGFGVFGVTGVILCFIGLLLSVQTFILPGNEEQVNVFMTNIFQLTFSVGLDVLAVFLLLKFMPQATPLRGLALTSVQTAAEGYRVAIADLSCLLQKTGVAVSPLRPAGKISIGEETYDAVTQGDFIQRGEKIKVHQVTGNRIIVEKCEG